VRFSSLNMVTTGALLLIAVLATIAATDASNGDKAFREKQSEKQRIQDQKEIAETARKNRVAQFEQLIVNNYDLSPSPPKLDWSKVVDPKVKSVIFDRNRICIGVAFEGKLDSITTNAKACDYGSS
jgi:hypothetical protein